MCECQIGIRWLVSYSVTIRICFDNKINYSFNCSRKWTKKLFRSLCVYFVGIFFLKVDFIRLIWCEWSVCQMDLYKIGFLFEFRTNCDLAYQYHKSFRYKVIGDTFICGHFEFKVLTRYFHTIQKYFAVFMNYTYQCGLNLAIVRIMQKNI